jgi:hypothetical protein
VWVWCFWFGFSLRSLALRLVCAIAPSFISGWRAFYSVSLSIGMLAPGSSVSPCATATRLWASPACITLLRCLAGPRCAASLVHRPQWSEVACLAVALADMYGCVWSLSRVDVSLVARICLCLASPLVCFALGLAPASSPFGPYAVRRVPHPSL